MRFNAPETSNSTVVCFIIIFLSHCALCGIVCEITSCSSYHGPGKKMLYVAFEVETIANVNDASLVSMSSLYV